MTRDATEGPDVGARAVFALEAARRAGEIVMGYFARARLAVEAKSDGSPVTIADREGERLLRRMILQAFPDDGVLGEEDGETPGRSGVRWVLDPIDGTASFVRGVPLFGTLVACELGERALAGVIHMPALGESVWAWSGGGAWHEAAGGGRTRARVSSVSSLNEAMFCTTSYDYFRRAGRGGAMVELLERSGSSRGWGDCYAYLLCATGRADVVVDPVMQRWDIAPMRVIIPEAGGRCTDWEGIDAPGARSWVVSNGRLHDEVVGLLGRGEAR